MVDSKKVNNAEIENKVNELCRQKGIKVRVMQSCWIAHAKELNSIPMKKGKPKNNPNKRVKECPLDLRPVFTEAFDLLGLNPIPSK